MLLLYYLDKYNIPKLILLSFEDLMKMVPLAGQRVGILFGL